MTTTYSKETGKLIRMYRKSMGLSLSDLASQIGKSRSTLSKYEIGEICIDIDTLYDISDALKLPVEALLPPRTAPAPNTRDFQIPDFFQKGLLYAYFWDNRSNKLNRSVLKIESQSPEMQNDFSAKLYMNVSDLEHYTICENTYVGTLHFYQMLIVINLTHRDTPLEHSMIQILENFTSDAKWGLWSGLSFRPLMPVALKMLFSQTPVPENAELKRKLLISKEDIRKLKNYNMFSAMQE